MALRAPLVDARSRDEIERGVRLRLAERIPGWTDAAPTEGAAAALLKVFARYVELTLERINQVPDRNMLAFLQHVGGAPRPAQPATVPVTFTLSPGARTDVVVPAGTQVSTSGTPPIVFETERQLVVTPARLTSAFVKDPQHDRYADAGAVLGDGDAAVAPFTGTTPIEHVAYIGHPDFFGTRPLDQLSLTFDLDEATTARVPREITWTFMDGETRVPAIPTEDTTAGLTRSGIVRFAPVPLVELSAVEGQSARWLRAEAPAMAGATVVRSITMERAVHRAALQPQAALVNAVPLDTTKEFLPLGERPRVGDVFCVAHPEAFSLPGATVTVELECVREVLGLPSAVDITKNPVLLWEAWDGAGWVPMGTDRGPATGSGDVGAFSDTTHALTTSGTVTFRIPNRTAEQSLGGVSSFWIRARLVGGGYEEGQAPLVRALRISYELGGPKTSTRPEAVLAYNDFEFRSGTRRLRTVMESFELFRPTAGRRPALYLGFDVPAGAALPTAPMSLFLGVDETVFAASTGEGDSSEPLLVWEYAAPSGAGAPAATSEWRRLRTRDRTQGLTRSGTVEILLPTDAAPTAEFGRAAVWIRLVCRGQRDMRVAPLQRVRANTVDAVQTTTYRDEVLGSSNGTASQVFRAARGGILAGPTLDVDEGAGEATSLAWTSWTEVDDFHASGPKDRHYVLDHAGGVITFGDGVHGCIPPPGTDNVRLALYRTGGGSAGNVPAGAIAQIKTSIPYLERATNPAPSVGGVDAETSDEYRDRAPAILRHQYRAVTWQDYEDLARLASGEVARATCVPLVDFADGVPVNRPGSVTIVVVPRSLDARPTPSLALLDRVHAYVSARQCPSASLVVRGPEYVAIDLDADVVVPALDRVTDVDVAIHRAIGSYLDPLRGGPDGSGWAFGRVPHRSDFFSIIAAIDGVDHVKAIRFQMREDRPGLLASGRFLICVGAVHTWFYSE